MNIGNQLVVYVILAMAVALVVSFLMTPVVKTFAYKVGAIDVPKDARRMHKVPIPRLGGLAIFIGFMVSILLFVPITPEIKSILLGAVIIVVLGVVDDIMALPAMLKFVVQIIAAAIPATHGVTIQAFSNPNIFSENLYWVLGSLSIPFTVLWIVAITNSVNLIDGLDGLAAGISAIASMTMFVLSVWAGRLDSAALSIAVVGSSLGFLRYNFHPASIFMGDSGSLTLGFALGVSSLLSVTRFAGLTTIAVPLVISAVPILDTFSAIVRRTRAHVSVGHADRGHIHHRLMDEGYDQRQSVLLMYGWTALLCVGSILMTQVETIPRILIFCALLVLSMLFARRLHLFEPVLLHHYDPKTGEDELVSPADAAFEEEARAQEAHHHGRHGRRAR